MAHFTFTGVNQAFHYLVEGFHTGRMSQQDYPLPLETVPSTQGECISIREPVTLTYRRPLERVLFNASRDANCFFHLYESLHMLVGRNDVAPLAYYNSNITRYSDDGHTLNGSAYGYRWRNHAWYVNDAGLRILHPGEKSTDQLTILINHLRNNPYSRRAVLSMWNVESDLLKIDKSLDIACNMVIVFKVETGKCQHCNGTGWQYRGTEFNHYKDGVECLYCKGMPHDKPRYLNMTVHNRSNDLIWGALGANYVHFTILQEYMAAHLGLEVGVYNQISDDLHVYTSRFNGEELLNWEHQAGSDDRPEWPQWWGYGYSRDANEPNSPILKGGQIPLVKDPATFDKELGEFVQVYSGRRDFTDYYMEEHTWDEPFLQNVARPMFLAFHDYKQDKFDRALMWCDLILADDWKIAAREWLLRRKLKREIRSNNHGA